MLPNISSFLDMTSPFILNRTKEMKKNKKGKNH